MGNDVIPLVDHYSRRRPARRPDFSATLAGDSPDQRLSSISPLHPSAVPFAAEPGPSGAGILHGDSRRQHPALRYQLAVDVARVVISPIPRSDAAALDRGIRFANRHPRSSPACQPASWIPPGAYLTDHRRRGCVRVLHYLWVVERVDVSIYPLRSYA